MEKENNVLGPKILNHDTFDFSNSSIINPNSPLDKDRSLIKKITIYTVDSRDRDYSTHPYPSKYVINLEEDIPDVISAELVDAHIPFKSYIVNRDNNKFSVEINNNKYNIELEQGNYTISQFCEEIQRKIKNIDTSYIFKMEYDEKSDKFIFYCNKSFCFCLNHKNINVKPFNSGKLMGFGLKHYNSKLNGSPKHIDAPHELKSEYRKNFEEEKYILLKISGFHVHHSINQMIDRTFAIIPEQRGNQNVNAELHTAFKHFNPPIARLSKLQISFVDHNGQQVDFQNHDHYFTLKLESLKHTRKYATFLDI